MGVSLGETESQTHLKPSAWGQCCLCLLLALCSLCLLTASLTVTSGYSSSCFLVVSYKFSTREQEGFMHVILDPQIKLFGNC